MSYDADSFKAGFALGRAMWRPPQKEIETDTGLGWSASPEYLVNNQGTWICDVGDRVYNKYTDGFAIAVLSDKQHSSWVGPLLISTVIQNVYTTQGPGRDIASFVYDGITWYVSFAYWLPGTPAWRSRVPVRTAEDGTYPDDAAGHVQNAIDVMQKANVRVFYQGDSA